MKKTVYVAIKSKKLNEEFCSAIDCSNVAKVMDIFYTLKDCRKKMAVKKPDVLLLGLDLPDRDCNWIEFCTDMREKYPGLKIMAVISYDEFNIFKNSLNELTSGYISKDALSAVIVSAVETVIEGNFFRYDKIEAPLKKDEPHTESLKTIYRDMIENIRNDDCSRDTVEKLSQFIDITENYRMRMIKDMLAEEKDLLDDESVDKYLTLLMDDLLLKGYPNWEIADMLNMNDETVRLYRLEMILRLRGKNSLGYIPIKDGNSIKLQRREQQLLRLIAAGYTNQEVADLFFFKDIETVKTIRKNLIEKFETKNTMTLVIKSLRMGLIKMEEIEEL